MCTNDVNLSPAERCNDVNLSTAERCFNFIVVVPSILRLFLLSILGIIKKLIDSMVFLYCIWLQSSQVLSRIASHGTMPGLSGLFILSITQTLNPRKL